MAPGLPLPKASSSAAPLPDGANGNAGNDSPPPSDPPLFIYVATALGVFLLALLLYYLRHRRLANQSSSTGKGKGEPPRVPSPHLPATEPFRTDPDSTPPVPPIPRRFLRESSVILETHATHQAVDDLENQARAKRRSSRPADRKADFRDHYNGPPGPLLIREDRDAVLQAATIRATMSAAQREAEERKKLEKKKKKRAAASSMSMAATATMSMAPGMDIVAEKQAKAEAKMKAYQERLERHEARQHAKLANAKALEPITPLLVREPPERLAYASLSDEIAEAIRNGPVKKGESTEPPLSPTPSSSSTILSTMSGPSSTKPDVGFDPRSVPLPASPLSPATLDGPVGTMPEASMDPWLVPLPSSPLSPTSLDSGVIVEGNGSGGPLTPIVEEEPEFPEPREPVPGVAVSEATCLLPNDGPAPTPDSAVGRSPALTPHPPDSASASNNASPKEPSPRTLDPTTLMPPVPPPPSHARRSRASALAKAGRAVHSMDAIMFHKVSKSALDLSSLPVPQPPPANSAALPTSAFPLHRRRGSLDGLPAPSPATLTIPPTASPSVSAPTSPTPPSSFTPASNRGGHHLLGRGRGRSRGRGTGRGSRFLERIASSGTILAPTSLTSSAPASSSRSTAPKSPLARHASTVPMGPDMDPARTTLVPGGTYMAIAAYLARKKDEVSVMRGDRVSVERVLVDGWCVGVNRDLDGARGVFPLYVVEEVEE